MTYVTGEISYIVQSGVTIYGLRNANSDKTMPETGSDDECL